QPGILARDTSAEIERRQIERWRRMTPAEKLEQVEMLRETALELARIGIRLRHPGAGEREVFLRLMERTLGPVLARRVYPEIDWPAP
ncbi:MAG: hypothetical protein ACREUG_07825, partial [Steroidobacteraceae bacterium]